MRIRFHSPSFLRLTSLLLVLLLLVQCMPLPVLAAESTNLAPNATVTTSYVSSWENLYAIQKTDTPASSASVNGDQYGNWPSSGVKTNWVEYSFPHVQRIDGSRVYWFEDREGIYAPGEAILQYFDGDNWIDLCAVETEVDCFNENHFEPIYTQKVRLLMTGAVTNSTGVKRWQLLGHSLDKGISLENTNATIQGSISVDNLAGTAAFSVTVDSEESQTFYAALSLHASDGSEVAAEKTPFTVEGGKTFTQDFSIAVPSALTLKCVVLDEDGLTPVTFELTSRCAPVTDNIAAFTAADIMLTDGIFKDAQDIDETFLLNLDVDRLCASLYRYSRKYKSGEIEMPADPYGGWESSGDKGLNGHSVGHYLSACSEIYLQTGNSEYLTRMNRAAELIAAVQDEDGFVGGFDRQYLDDSLSDPDNISSGGTNGAYLGGIWAPWYSVHKILQGAIDVYTVTGNETALAIAEGIASYAGDKAAPLNDVQMEVMLRGEHGGINESLANLYEVTGNPEYIELAKRYSHKAILDPLANGVDSLSGYHANTQIPKIVGAAKIYLLTGDVYYRDAAEFFWKTVVENRSYANGGNSNAEHFTNPGTEPLSNSSTETCNTYNMLKLTELLYRIDPKPEYVDYYENALYNHILGSQNPQGHKTYYINLTQGGRKVYSNGFECCVGTGMENHTRYTHMVYCTNQDTLQVNLFINSVLHWEEGGMTLTQQTDFPVQDTTTITVDSASGEERTIRLRVPGWTNAPQVLVNGEAADVVEENGYLSITRNWVAGDTITYTLPMESSIYVSRDDEHLIAFKYGPILLAGELTEKVKPLVSDEAPATLPVRTAEDSLRFEIRESLRPGYTSITLKPFYEFISERHMVYWTLYTTQEYEAMGGDAYHSLSERMDKLTIDRAIPGNSESEQSHNLQITGSSSRGFADSADAYWRDTSASSSFSYRLQVEPGKTNYLACAFWGSDAGGNRIFDILVDDVVVAKDYTLNQNLPGKLFYQYYPLTPEALAGKSHITVTFRAGENAKAGGVFDVRTMRQRILADDLAGPYETYYQAEPTVLGSTQGDTQQVIDYHHTVDNGWAFAPDAYITIDLQRSYTVKRLLLMPASKLGAMPKDCEIYVSNEAPTYAETNAGLTVAGLRDADKAATLSFEEGGFRDAQVLPSSAEGRYVTIHVLSTQNGAAGAVAEIALEITTETKAETAAKAAEAAQAAAQAAQAAAEEAHKAAEAAAETAGQERSAAEAAAQAAENALSAAQTALEAAQAAEAAAKSADASAAQNAAASAEAAAEAAASAAEAAKAQSAAQTAQAKAEAAQKAAEDAAEAAQEASEATAENKAAAEAAKEAAQKAQQASEAASEEARKAAEAAGASDASAAREAAEAAASAAEAAVSAAEAAKAQSAAQAAQAKAEAAQKAAEDAAEAAQEAGETTAENKAAAEAAAMAAEKAQQASEAAQEAAREAASAAGAADANAARKAAEAAASAAESAAFAAQAAKAQSAAQAAQAKAEAAQKAAEDAQLGAAKYYALTQLALFAATADNTGRTEEEMAAWSAAMEDGIAAIEAAKDPAAVTAALEETLGKLAMEPQDTCPSRAFTDVPGKDNWAHEGIDYCVENDLMNGVSDTAFLPQGTVTRAQLVTILYRAAGAPNVTQSGTFRDVSSGKWYSKAIEWAAQNGIVNGIGNGLFGPEQSITREQIAAILYRYEGSPETDGNLNAFPDHTTVSSFASKAMIWATQKGLINGVTSGDTLILSSKSNASRAQIAAIMMRYLSAK